MDSEPTEKTNRDIFTIKIVAICHYFIILFLTYVLTILFFNYFLNRNNYTLVPQLENKYLLDIQFDIVTLDHSIVRCPLVVITSASAKILSDQSSRPAFVQFLLLILYSNLFHTTKE
jgi:hypothetical protein